jgi:hypothetical protein
LFLQGNSRLGHREKLSRSSILRAWHSAFSRCAEFRVR